MDDLEELAICGIWRLDLISALIKLVVASSAAMGQAGHLTIRLLYYDTFQDVMWAYDYDIETGASRTSVNLLSKGRDGIWDGSTVIGGLCLDSRAPHGQLVRRTPDGEEERRIGMPVKNITSVMFGGVILMKFMSLRWQG